VGVTIINLVGAAFLMFLVSHRLSKPGMTIDIKK
jgi:hypothetical protein